MDKCKNCNHDWHCGGKEHIDEYLDICQCGQCNCQKGKAEDSTYENNGVVVDDTGECESCQ